MRVDETRDGAPWWFRYQMLFALGAICLAFVISASWLVFPYAFKGRELLGNVGGEVKQAKLEQSITIGQFLSRTSFGVGEAQVDVLFATPRYFAVTELARKVEQYRPDQHLVFFVTETTHIEELTPSLPKAILLVDGKEVPSVDTEGPLAVYHHRVSTIRFPAFDENGNSYLGAQELHLKLENGWDYSPDIYRDFNWSLPLEYPENLESSAPWTPLMVLGLSSGLLSFVLTPCLIQLLVVYMATFTGISAEQMQNSALSKADRKRKMFSIAVAFVIGFMILFVLTGAAIGYAGKEMQIFFAVWSSKLSVLAGIVVVASGIWMGARARAPWVCKIVPERLVNIGASDSGAWIGSAVTAVGFTLGCLTCFGGAIIATLLVYVGALGSAFIGAMVMLAFSVGVVVPFLLGAFFLSRLAPAMSGIEKLAPAIGFISMLVIVAFGMVLITDNFHVLSDFIYPFLGLDQR